MTSDTSPIVSAGYDRQIHVWDRTTFQPKYALTGHTGYINTLAISPDSTLVASGGHDQHINLNDIPSGRYLYNLPAQDVVNSIVFSPNRFWIAVATDSGLKIFCLNMKKCIIDLKLQPADLEAAGAEAPAAADGTVKKVSKPPRCLSCAFSVDGMNLFAGYSDGCIRCWNITASA
jgi:guanine nucleotide-binding protein subunit beta-2-like 1 protein